MLIYQRVIEMDYLSIYIPIYICYIIDIFILKNINDEYLCVFMMQI